MNSISDTIIALSTPSGVGAIGLIRMSGDHAISIVNHLFIGKDLTKTRGGSVHFGTIQDRGIIIDEVLVTVFTTPHSYTGEDVVEISCHGSPYIIQEIIRLCLAEGAILAGPGEFTQRAFLNKKMDLAQAEAVADLIAAESRAMHDMAMHQMRGGFSGDLTMLREQLIEFTALLELELDFSEEDVEFADRDKFIDLVNQLHNKTKSLLESFRLGNVVKKGISVAIIGKPNAGKSTLLNALLNEERAIVSDIAGTTRDTIEETININGVLFRLIDTAGIREHSVDVIENMGIERSKTNAGRSDIVLLLIDLVAEGLHEIEYFFEEFPWLTGQSKTVIPVYNKCLLWKDYHKYSGDSNIDDRAVLIDAKEKVGIDELKQIIFSIALGEDFNTGNTIITNVRHRDILEKMQFSLGQIAQGLSNGLSGDLIAIDIHQCLRYIGELTGRIEVDRDILGAIFGRFCIGK